MDKDFEHLKKFNLDSNETVYIEHFRCIFHGGKVPLPGKLFIFNNYVCFSSKLNKDSYLLGGAT